MERVHRRAGAGVALLLGGLVNIGCTDEQTAFFIRGNVVIEAPECIARPDDSSILLSSGLLDVALKPDYEATLIVGSQLAPRGDKSNLRTETMITTITGAEVHLYRDTGELEGRPFTVPATGVIRPDSGDDPGFGIITAILIPAATGIALRDELENPAELLTRVAEVSVFGKTIGGLEVESAKFTYVIQVCEGCIVDFPAEALVAQMGTGATVCGGALEEVPDAPCRPGQDDALDCRLCFGGNDYCLFPGGPAP